ncbi:NADPH Oxidase [Seminavis robusta]|uniref:NADPH Oxidase n=1 Tax=Seminavis robusta TaxID=568900 RepID=A0A9N8DSU8_9STRA|nr:NADPH Oxidase [Seminavis robusta]|eukprot:Sro318_g115900.1 NADPH Oxidase (527) ;mRNA; f:26210-28048
MTTITDTTSMSASARTALSLLYDTELFLRRQLQATAYGGGEQQPPVDGMHPSLADSSVYNNNNPQPQSETSQSRGRTVLTILYLCVLGLCFVVPVFYYFRLHCFEENARRELELDFSAALELSTQHRDENRAARRKYIEERRARIVQLMMPVRMILKEENFPELVDGPDNHNSSSNSTPDNPPPKPVQRAGSFLNFNFESEKYKAPKDDDDDDDASQEVQAQEHDNNISNDTETVPQAAKNDLEDDSPRQEHGVIEAKSQDEEEQGGESHHSSPGHVAGGDDPPKEALQNNPYDDEETLQIRIPVPGLPMGGSCFLDPTRQPQRQQQQGDDEREMRLTPGHCTICLSNYKVGSDIVWSSNESCDHHFHASCIEKWLMKQREGPLCPICRRDFVVDPLDLLEEDNNNHNIHNINNDISADEEQGIETPMFQWDPATLSMEEEEELGGIVVMAPGEQQETSGHRTIHIDNRVTTAQLEEGDVGGPSSDESGNNTGGNTIDVENPSSTNSNHAPDETNESTEGGVSAQL